MKKTILSLMMAICAIGISNADDFNFECGKSAEVTITPQTGYHFVNWSDGNTDNPRVFFMEKDSTITVNIAINTYSVVFKNWNDTALQSETLNHGDAIEYKGASPTKPSTAQYSYKFTAWNPNIPNPAVATQDWVFVAQFEATVNQYTVIFKNYNGDTLQLSKYDYGATPEYKGETPVKPADAQYTYTFTGWDKTISEVTGDVVYTAQFTNSTNTYTLAVEGENGVVTGSGTYQYGAQVQITATPNDCYEFVKWSDGDTNATRTVTVTGDITYTAIFQKIVYKLTINLNDAEHATVTATEVQ